MQNARMIIAIAVFVAAAFGGVYAMAYLPETSSEIADAASASSPMARASKDGAGFFYDSIGQGDSLAVAPSPAPGPSDTPGLTSDEATKASYTLELAVTQSREEAESLIEDFRDRGIDAYYTPLSRSGKVVYRVRRGMYPTQREAQKAAVALKDEGAKVVRLQ